MELNASSQPAVYVYTNTGKPQGASFGVRVLEGAERNDQFNSMWKFVDEIPLGIPKGIFANSQKSLILFDK